MNHLPLENNPITQQNGNVLREMRLALGGGILLWASAGILTGTSSDHVATAVFGDTGKAVIVTIAAAAALVLGRRTVRRLHRPSLPPSAPAP